MISTTFSTTSDSIKSQECVRSLVKRRKKLVGQRTRGWRSIRLLDQIFLTGPKKGPIYPFSRDDKKSVGLRTVILRVWNKEWNEDD